MGRVYKGSVEYNEYAPAEKDLEDVNVLRKK